MTDRGDFWARRKAAVQAEQQTEELLVQDQATQADLAALEEKDDAEILAELNLPDPDALKLGDDVTGFMSKAVPDRLRRRALRTLWRLNPVLANVDGLVDYGEDFTDAACVIENLQTSYQVGKGMLAHVEEMARQAEEAEAAKDAPQDAKASDDSAPEADAADAPDSGAETSGETPLAAHLPQGEDEIVPLHSVAFDEADWDDDPAPPMTAPAPRRMRFEFHG